MDLARNLIQRVNIGDTLTRSAAARPDHPAIVDNHHGLGPAGTAHARLGEGAV